MGNSPLLGLHDDPDFLAALEKHGEEPYFTDEQDYKIHQLETELRDCRENLANHEQRLIALEGKNANGRQ